MDKAEVVQKLIMLMKDVLKKDAVTAEMDIMDEIGLESVEVLQFVGLAETEYGLSLPSRELRGVSTIDDLGELIVKKLQKKAK